MPNGDAIQDPPVKKHPLILGATDNKPDQTPPKSAGTEGKDPFILGSGDNQYVKKRWWKRLFRWILALRHPFQNHKTILTMR